MVTTAPKLRNSAVRNDIYTYLCGTKEHPSAEMIYNDLKGDNPNLSLGTVYRNLKQLEEIGKIIRVTNVNNHERYDANCEDHVHFVCERCGRVIDIIKVSGNKVEDFVVSTRQSAEKRRGSGYAHYYHLKSEE